MINKSYKLGDFVIMRKSHACKTNKWIIKRVGVDIKLQCAYCGREIMMERLEFERKLKKVIGDEHE